MVVDGYSIAQGLIAGKGRRVMRYISFRTDIPDPYRAGMAIGERMEAQAPEAVILFCTRGYIDELPEVVAGIREILGAGPLLCGGTGDGVYETSGAAHNGISALGICSEGAGEFRGGFARGIQQDSFAAAQAAAATALGGLERSPTLAFVMADGCKADGSRFVAGLNQVLPVPFFGGLAADDRRFERTVVFLNDEVAEDAVMVLVIGGEIPFCLNAASGWCPVGEAGRITRAEGKVLHEINDRPAAEFFREQTGKTVGTMDLGIASLAEYTDLGDEKFVLRSSASINEETGQVVLFGGVSEGSQVRVCRASVELIIAGVRQALAGAMRSGMDPKALVIISCAGRKWALTESGAEEVREAIREVGEIPLIGMPSFGEISPFLLEDGSYSSGMFHNVTFVAGVFGG